MTSGGFAFTRAHHLTPFLKWFEQRGGRTDQILESVGLAHLDLADPTTLISGEALYQAVNDMADALGDPYFAARAGEALVKSGPILVRESYHASHTLAEFLPLAVLELNRQISNIQYSVVINATYTVIRGERSFKPVAPTIQADAGFTGMWVTFLKLAVGGIFDPARILVTARSSEGIPRDMVPKAAILKRTWSGVQIRFPSEWLQQPLKMEWEFAPIRRGKFDETTPHQAILEFIEAIYIDGIDQKAFGIEYMARNLGLHPKALQRRLARLGTSFKDVRDGALKKKALVLLETDPPLPSHEIAEMLGFSGTPAFSRAFKRWMGVSPTAYRKTP